MSLKKNTQTLDLTDGNALGCNHPFITEPNKTLMRLSLPVLFSLIAEPVTGLVDTAFIARLGATSLAALGVGTMVLSSLFWIFNFLGIGTQTEVAKAFGQGRISRVRRMGTLAIALALTFGVLMALIIWPLISKLAVFMGASGQVHSLALEYIRIRLFGAPAVLITVAAFGVFRGQQDMRTPLVIATAVNLLNMVLDPLLIFGYGLLPQMGVGGAALASVISQWAGAITLMALIYQKAGFSDKLQMAEAGKLLNIGKNLVIRTGMLTLFLLLATRAATELGAAQGAAHQAIRQVSVLTAFLLDAYAVTAQSLVAYFVGAQQFYNVRRVVWVVCKWSLLTGVVIGLAMWFCQSMVIKLLVPAVAVSHFTTAWLISLLTQPINALAFATDGIHWGMGDFRFLRNAVLIATILAGSVIFFMQGQDSFSVGWIWAITTLWIVIRAGAGILRIWPGTASSPMRQIKEARSV
ncbi:MAG: MATE family efflux transporter [Desulfobacteraceae bacterium]|nr:MATE family efflux transporter [Desulfobacteraceae bacterium]